MNKRKQDLMYLLFGQADGQCKDCEHLIHCYHNRWYQKCECYGNTNSISSDWSSKYQACGLFPDKPYNGRPVIELVKPGKSKQEPVQCEGQIDLFSQENGR